MRRLFSLLILILIALVSVSAFPLDPDNVNPFDRTVMMSYSKTLSGISLGIGFAAALTPAMLFIEPASEYLTIGVMYAEALALSFGTKELIKHLVTRERPYMYDPDTPQSLVESDKHDKSFFSGHTTYAFTGAAFASYVFCKYNPESKWRIPVIAASFSLATATAALRVASGNHFMTDVIAGAIIGTAIGIAVPALHTLLAEKDITVSASPFGLVFSKSY